MNQTTNFSQQPADNLPNNPTQPEEVRVGNEAVKVPVLEEQLHVGKKVVETGRIRISKNIVEQQESVSMPLNQEEVNVERVNINQYVETAPPPVRYEGDIMVIPVLKEVIVVQKKLLLVEELRVTKRQVVKQETQQVTLRKEEVHVARVADRQANE